MLLNAASLQVETCKYRFASSREMEPLGSCDMGEFDADYDSEITQMLDDSCEGWDEGQRECSEDCEEYTRSLIETQPCLNPSNDPDTYNYTLKRE